MQRRELVRAALAAAPAALWPATAAARRLSPYSRLEGIEAHARSTDDRLAKYCPGQVLRW